MSNVLMPIQVNHIAERYIFIDKCLRHDWADSADLFSNNPPKSLDSSLWKHLRRRHEPESGVMTSVRTWWWRASEQGNDGQEAEQDTSMRTRKTRNTVVRDDGQEGEENIGNRVRKTLASSPQGTAERLEWTWRLILFCGYFHIFLHFHFVLQNLSYLCNCLADRDVPERACWCSRTEIQLARRVGVFALAMDAAHGGKAGFFT